MDEPCPVFPATALRPGWHKASAAGFSAVLLALFLALPAVAGPAIYKWVDAGGVTHLSSEKPPAGVAYQRLDVPGSSSARSPRIPSRSAPVATKIASVSSPQQSARRDDVIQELQTRECVVALEAIDRHAHGKRTLEPAEVKRLQQTANRNCSPDPTTRREQYEMAARLRVAKGDACVDARNALAEMLQPGRRPQREQLKTQQEFIESHCRAPVR